MIESLMLMALGFFIATLFAIAAARLIWRRAAKVTAQRLGATDEAENDGAGHSADLDTLLAQQRREMEPLHNEIAALTRKNEALQADSDELRAQVAAAQDEIAARDDRLATLGDELARIGLALRDETRRQDEHRETLQNLSETAARLAGETAPAPTPAAAAPHPLEPYTDGNDDADRRTLATIAASIKGMDHENAWESAENGADHDTADADAQRTAEAQLGDRALAARIRALEAGVTS